jgi:hypothetical protein
MYNTMTLEGLRSKGCEAENNDDTNNNSSVVDGPTVLAHVELAKTLRTLIVFAHKMHSNRAVIERRYTIADLATEINQPHLLEFIRRFLYDQLYSDTNLSSVHVSLNACPAFSGLVSVFSSAMATYYAPSDPSRIGGMHSEYIRATPS